ncbi:MAG: hypothetical protein B7Y45_11530 [Sphingomonas sp. 28-66-16]|nr:MAG: hypothetical protein B7Y45_11530 [Sphingomonas sp. 28-66-16]
MADDTTAQIGDRMKAAADSFKASTEKMSETSAAVGLKLLDQAETNTREAFAAMRATAQARDASEIMRIQSEYLRDQGNRAMTQVREIGELISGFGRDAMSQMTRRD